MVIERTRPFRLVERGGAGLACDADGISLGGIPLASVDPGAQGARRYFIRPPGEVGAVLAAAYGPQRDEVIQRFHRGLRRATSALEDGGLALAGIEAVMLRLPDIDADAMAKLAALADLQKGGDSWQNEPRVPAGQPEGGQWTTGGGGGGAAPPDRTPTRPAPGRAAQARRPSPRSPARPPGRPMGASRTGQAAASSASRAPPASPRPVRPKPPTPLPSERGGRAGPDIVDVSNAVAGSLVDFAHWLGEPQTYVPIAPEIAAGEPGFPMGPALEATTDPHAFRDWRPVSHLEAAADVASAVGELAPAARLLAGEAEVGGEVVRFSSAAKLKRYLGSPGPGNEWHHVVEQTPKNLKRFGAQAIHRTDNVVAIPKSVHRGKDSVSAYYSSNQPFTKGRTVRRWLSTQSFRAQRQFGIRTLKDFGQ